MSRYRPARSAPRARGLPAAGTTWAIRARLGMSIGWRIWSRPQNSPSRTLLTGVSVLVSGLAPKRLELIRELVRSVSIIVLLVNQSNPNVQTESPEAPAAADALALHLEVCAASAERELASLMLVAMS
jgi:hypothetical protein